MSHAQRVVVTGLGQVSSLGTDLRSFADRLFAGRPGVSDILGLEAPGLERPIGAAIPSFDLKAFHPSRALQNASPVTQYAYAAASQAFESARLERLDRPRGGVFVGSGFGGLISSEECYKSCFSTPGQRPKPSVIPTAMSNASAGFLASELRLKGPNLTFCVACASGTHAIGQAYRLLRAGDADLMLAGGVDAPLTQIILAAWNAMRVLAPRGPDPTRASRPFSRDRQGLVIGEGAGFIILETLEHAERREAPVLAEIVGYGMNADAGHITHPDADGVRNCLRLALEDARLEPSAIGYINAHGTGTVVNDRVEAEAIAAVFGDHARRLLVSSTKSVHGHAMGASGGLEAIATVLALVEGRIPPTANLREVDPELPPLDFVPLVARKAAVEYALSNSFAFGGNNAVLAFRRT